MDRISFIPQMRGFMAKMQEDRLPGNAVKLYICLFDVFNKSCWKKEWVRVSVDCLKICFGRNSHSLIYSNRKLLEDSGYIQVRSGHDAHHRYTEFKLLKLYDDYGSTTEASASQYTHFPDTGTGSGKHPTKCPSPEGTYFPNAGTQSGTESGTHFGKGSTSEALPHKASQLPKKKEVEIEVPHLRSIPSTGSIQHIDRTSMDTGARVTYLPGTVVGGDAARASSGGGYEETYQVFGICFGREAEVEEKLSLIELIRQYNKDNVEAALLVIADEHQAYTKELCKKHIQRQLYGLTARERRPSQVPGWDGFRPA